MLVDVLFLVIEEVVDVALLHVPEHHSEQPKLVAVVVSLVHLKDRHLQQVVQLVDALNDVMLALDVDLHEGDQQARQAHHVEQVVQHLKEDCVARVPHPLLPFVTQIINPVKIRVVRPVEITDEVGDEDEVDGQGREVLDKEAALVFLPFEFVVPAHDASGAPKHPCHNARLQQIKTYHEQHAPLVVELGKEARHEEEGHADHEVEDDEEAEDLFVAAVVYDGVPAALGATYVQAAAGTLRDIVVVVHYFRNIPVLLRSHYVPHDCPLADLQVVDAEDEDEDYAVKDIEQDAHWREILHDISLSRPVNALLLVLGIKHIQEVL